MADINEIRNGMVLDFKNALYVVVKVDHVKPGKGSAFARCRLKNITTGSVIDQTWKSSESVSPVRVETRDMQFLFNDGGLCTFMDMETYEQLSYDITGENIEGYLKENLDLEAMVYEENIIGLELPFFVNLKVAETEPGAKGNTATNATKPATMETGLIVQVPLFITNDEVLKIEDGSCKWYGYGRLYNKLFNVEN